MRTCSFKSVCDRAMQRIGLDPDTVPSATLLALGNYADEAVREAWYWTDWPELTSIEGRALRPEFDPAIANALNDEVHYSITGKYYRCTATNTGIDPTDPLFWEEATDLEPYMELAQRGQTEIGLVDFACAEDPRVNPNAIRYVFQDRGDRIYFPGDVPLAFWLKYWLREPEFTRVEYSNATAYVAGDVRYYPTTGECYRALQATTGNAPTDPAYWVQQDFPLVLRTPIAFRIAAALQREDGQSAKAAELDALADEALQDEQDQFTIRTEAARR